MTGLIYESESFFHLGETGEKVICELAEVAYRVACIACFVDDKQLDDKRTALIVSMLLDEIDKLQSSCTGTTRGSVLRRCVDILNDKMVKMATNDRRAGHDGGTEHGAQSN